MFKQKLSLILQIIMVFVAGLAFGLALVGSEVARGFGFAFMIGFFFIWIHNLVFINKKK